MVIVCEISNCSLQILQNFFDEANSLKLLDISHNKIKKFQDGMFNSLDKFGEFKLCYNDLIFLNSKIFRKLNNFEMLYLNDNKLQFLDQ